MQLVDLETRNFRNLVGDRILLSPATNVVLGANGAGKTSLLEATAILGNLRSFRTASLRRAASHGEAAFRLAGTVQSGSRRDRVEVIVDIGPPVVRTLRVDGAPVDVEHYLQICPVFAISRHDRDLVDGGPEVRRALLDRFIFLQKPAHLADLRSYKRALRQRNAALIASEDAEIEAWEQPLAAAAARIVAAREGATEVLAEQFSEVWKELSPVASPPISVAYRSDAWRPPFEGAKKVEVLYQQRYNETRTRDRQTGFTVDGPHRHDVSLTTNGRSVRYVLSSGQAKGVAAALKLATLVQIERERRENLPVIVDDVDAELDSTTLTRLVKTLGSDRQLFLSSTSVRVAELAGPRGCCIWLKNGASVSQEGETDE